MRKEIIVLDKEKGTAQITTPDERWYINESGTYVPSVSWICSYYPSGSYLIKWICQHGWEEAERLKMQAGIKGTKVHFAINDLLNGRTITLETAYITREMTKPEELTQSEYAAAMSFTAWYNKYKPETINTEFVIFGDGYAGTVDYHCKIDGDEWVIDFKTSKAIYPSHKLQLSAYQHVINPQARMGVLQLGYTRNKDGYKFTEIDDCYDLFLSVKDIWGNECANVEPKQREYPLKLSLNLKGGAK